MFTTTHVYPLAALPAQRVAALGSADPGQRLGRPQPAMRQLANDPASSPPVNARITPTATAQGLTCTDIGTAAVWLATTVVTGRPRCRIRVPVGVVTLPESLGAIASMTAAPVNPSPVLAAAADRPRGQGLAHDLGDNPRPPPGERLSVAGLADLEASFVWA